MYVKKDLQRHREGFNDLIMCKHTVTIIVDFLASSRLEDATIRDFGLKEFYDYLAKKIDSLESDVIPLGKNRCMQNSF